MKDLGLTLRMTPATLSEAAPALQILLEPWHLRRWLLQPQLSCDNIETGKQFTYLLYAMASCCPVFLADGSQELQDMHLSVLCTAADAVHRTDHRSSFLPV